MSANGVWCGRFQKAYFDVRVSNPLTPSNSNQAPPGVYRKDELEKKRAYQQQIQQVKHSSFTPLALSSTGGMGNEATIFTSARHHCSPRIGTSRTITRPDSFACMRQACMHWFVHAYQYHGIVIDKRSIVAIDPSRLVLKLQSWTKSYQKCST